MPEDMLVHIMMLLSLSRLAQLKLVHREWRRAARRVLTSDAWLLLGKDAGTSDEELLITPSVMTSPVPPSMHNLRAMRRVVEYKWTSLQLPCRVEIIAEGKEKMRQFGILEDLDVNVYSKRIRSITLEVNGHRFCTPGCIYCFINGGKEYPDNADAEDLDQWILDGVFPLLPGNNVWPHPCYSTLSSHLNAPFHKALRSTGALVLR